MAQPDDDFERPDQDELDIEAPPDDARDQATPADPADLPDGAVQPGLEVGEWDAVEQSRVVERDDDYR